MAKLVYVMREFKSMSRFQQDTESRELAQCCGHGVLSIIAHQLRRPTGPKNKPPLPYNWASRRDMLLASTSSDVDYPRREADHRSWVSSFLWEPSRNSAMMLLRQMICTQI